MAKCLKSHTPDKYRIQVSQWEPFIVDKNPDMLEEEPIEEHSQQTPRARFYTFGSFLDPDDISNKDPFDEALQAPSNDSSIVQENTEPKLLSLKPPAIGMRRPSFIGTRRPSNIGRSVSAFTTPAVGDGPLLSSTDLWDKDKTCHEATREGFIMSPDAHGYGGRNVTIGLGEAASIPTQAVSGQRHRRAVSFDPGLVSQSLQEEVESLVIKDRLHGYVRHHQMPSNVPPPQESTEIHNNSQEFP